MEIRRFYVNPADIDGNVVIITGDEFRHMTKVLRHKVGFKVVINNNFDGIDYHAVITAINKDSARAEIYDKITNDCKCDTDVTLYQACPKNDKIDIIVQKACELGVNKFVLFKSAYSEKSEVNIARLQRIIVEACKQCGRSRVPVVEGVIDFGDAVARLSKGLSVHFNEHERYCDFSALDLTDSVGGKLNIVIGAEGGFSLEEAQIFNKCAHSVTLGKRILRCETAAITAIALTMYKLGELGGSNDMHGGATERE